MCTYNINYNDYNANLCDGLQSILASSEMSDVTLAVEGKYFKAHQLILSMFSTYFRELFQVIPSKSTIFFMKNVKHRIMKNLLAFMYEGKVQIPSEDFELFVETANELKIKGLVNDSDLKTTETPSTHTEVGETSQHSEKKRAISPQEAFEISEQMTKKTKTENEIPSFPSEVSIFPCTTTQSDPDRDPEETDEFKLSKPYSIDEGPAEISALNEDTINLDDDEDVNLTKNVSINSLQETNVLLAGISQESMSPSIQGEPVTVTFCKQINSQKVTGCIWNNFRYFLKYERPDLTRWRCTFQASQNCRARMIITQDGHITLVQGHNHDAGRMNLKSTAIVSSRIFLALPYDDFAKKFQKT